MPRKALSARRAGPLALGIVTLTVSGIGVSACGSSTSISSAVSADDVIAATAPATNNGFKGGFWVGNGSATEQEIVYVAKMANYLTAAANPGKSESFFTSNFFNTLTAGTVKVAAPNIKLLPGSNTADPLGMKPASFKITEAPTVLAVVNTSVATVEICSIETEHGVYKYSNEPVQGVIGATGPTKTEVQEELTGNGWQVTYMSEQTATACPPGHPGSGA